jgi:hypothetical protein
LIAQDALLPMQNFREVYAALDDKMNIGWVPGHALPVTRQAGIKLKYFSTRKIN